MPKLMQINVVYNMLSTGTICEDISRVATDRGWDCYMAYGRWSKAGTSNSFRCGSNFDMIMHYVGNVLFDREGLASKHQTEKLIKKISLIQPDVIVLHVIHDHYMNYPILFKYLSSVNIPVVWVQHDCWSFTGGCPYYCNYGCNLWKSGCTGHCPDRWFRFSNNRSLHYLRKQKLFTELTDLHIVPVSNWLADLIRQSFLKNKNIKVIHNGVDISKYRVTKPKDTGPHFKILGVAAVWSRYKGLSEFIKLRTLLPETYEITLVGLTYKQLKSLPKGINGRLRTFDIESLVKMYNDADVFVNPTNSDTFPLTNIEALACGTPVISYRTGGVPEALRDGVTGFVVEQGDILALADAIVNMKEHPLSSDKCREWAVNNFDKSKCYSKYVDLFEELVQKRHVGCDN